MAFARRNYDRVGTDAHMLGSVLEYNADAPDEPARHYRFWFVTVGVVLVVASILGTRGCLSRGDRRALAANGGVTALPKANSNPVTNVVAAVRPASARVPASSVPPLTPAAKQAQRWLAQSEMRPAAERVLLERLARAERDRNYRMAADSIEKLRARASMADLDDALARRLGTLNMKFLFSADPMPGVAVTSVRRGDSLPRIAREHGTTTVAVRRLNRLDGNETPETGRRLRVLEFPRATLVVHRRVRFADLMLNGKFFQRYYLGTVRAAPGSYPITRAADGGPRTRIAALGIPMAPSDLCDVEMFLAPGATISVSEF